MQYDLVLMSLVIFVPALAALPLCLRWIFPRGSEEWMRWWTLLATAVTLMLSLFLFIEYYRMADEQDQGGRPGHSREVLLDARVAQEISAEHNFDPPHNADWVARVPWIPQFNINYYIGIDGISLPLILLTTVIGFLAMLASWNIDQHVRGYCILFLILETGMIGTFLALDFFLFFVFWEVMLL
ncbi:MAG: hypothetical protein Q9M29_04645, partial [Mariprofundaceae bacterium]|nr:hypothetical protein [Mariprofundaceae bacterium]